MAVEINGKVYRNLPEQVKKNQDDIEELQGSVEEQGDKIEDCQFDISVLEGEIETKADDNAVVHKTGNETISGVKTFSSNMEVNYSNKRTIVQNNGFKYQDMNSLAIQNLVFADPSVAHTVTIPAKDGTIALLSDITALNIQNGTGTNAARQKMADTTVNFTGRNPNAEALDPTISTTINTGASGNQSVAFGKNTMALATASFTNGNKTLAKGEESHAEGYQSVTLGDGSHAEGAQTVAAGLQSHSEGALTQALGDESHAEGHNTIAGALASHSEGAGTKVGNYSQESGIGADHTVSPTPGPSPTPTPPIYVAQPGEGSHVEGYSNIVSGYGSHAEGVRNYISGNYAHAEGINNSLLKNYAHVSGFNNVSNADCSETSGIWNTNNGYGAFVTGFYNESSYNHQAIVGKYNDNKSNTLFEVGNGTADNARKNAFEVYEDGTLGIPNFNSSGTRIGTKRIKCINGVLTVID